MGDARPIIHEYWLVRVWPKESTRVFRWYIANWSDAEPGAVNRWHADHMTKLQAAIAVRNARRNGLEAKVIHVTTREKTPGEGSGR